MRGHNLTKFLKVFDEIAKKNGATMADLMKALGTKNRSSVHRMLGILHDLEFPILDEKDPHDARRNIWKLEASFAKKLSNITLPNLNIDPSEILALYMLKSALPLFKGTHFENVIQSVFAKLDQFLPPNFSQNIKRLNSLFLGSHKMTKDYSGKEALIDDLTRAMIGNIVCRVKYHAYSGDTVKSYEIEPLHFLEHNGGLYLYVRFPKYGDYRVLAVERFQKITRTSKTFKYPANFDPEVILDSSFDLVWDDPVEAKIWFSASQAKYIRERHVPGTQGIIPNPNGSIVLEIKTSGQYDVLRWVLGFGPDAEILEPKSLRDQARQALQDSLSQY